ncbi:cytokinin dehydrogenase 1-like protein [Lentzea atacamensis]|uniref:Cytokinin dehydrogenase 1-like protein n=1 Tax=Lentzea atacamensis TaxID=531938 RepID=A0ABX9EMD2_9PSEU|nr:FAD-binding protein [Lentzea atacamensis]RAS71018.1 cytokinin dehydrogenase 1-like protein [Lentzea atacamensis]
MPLHTDEATLRWAAQDYGDLVHHRPAAVLRTTDITEISALLRENVLVVPRGAGHSLGGQAQAPDGVVVDMTALHTVHEVRPDRVIVDAGAKWSDVLRATLPLGLTPPVLTDYLELTVGGTLSVGGLGGASHHHGAQTDNVLALDVLRPSGELVTCGHTDGALAGKGRHGIVVRATLRLVPAPETVQWHKLRYKSASELVADQRVLVQAGSFDYVEGQLKIRNGRRVAELEAVSYRGASLDGLEFEDADTRITSYWDFVNRLAVGEPLLREAGLWDSPHPWCNLLVPDHAVEEVLQHLECEGPELYSDFGLVLAYPLRSELIRAVELPEGEVVFLVAALRYARGDDPTAVNAMQEANDVLVEKALQMGGVRYLDQL